MKKAITSLMALMVSLTITLAGTGNGFGNGGTPQGKVTGNGTQLAHYTATYADYFFGPVTCTGVHQTGKNFPGLGQDSFTCTAQPAGNLLQGVIANQTLTISDIGGWISDFYNLGPAPQVVYASAFRAVVSSDGKSYTAVANY